MTQLSYNSSQGLTSHLFHHLYFLTRIVCKSAENWKTYFFLLLQGLISHENHELYENQITDFLPMIN